MNVTWGELKSLVDAKGLSIQFIESSDKYILLAVDAQLILQTELDKNPSDTTDLDDFETHYKAAGNRTLSSLQDSGGALIQTPKMTQTGWTFQMHGIEFTTSLLNSIESDDETGNPHDITTIKFYELLNGEELEITGNNLTQEYITAHCIKTVVDWEPTFEYDIIGGSLRQRSIPSNDVYLWVVAVPDVPAEMGGSKVLLSAIDMGYINPNDGLRVDGRVAKFMPYSATYHTNKFRFILRHTVGFQHSMLAIMEIYKA